MGKFLPDENLRVYRTSDNTIFRLTPDRDLKEILKHCSENGIKLFDESGNEIITKKKKQ